MHAKQQAEIAAWVALNSASILHGSQRIEAVIAASFWSDSKSRLARWGTALKTFDQDIRNPDSAHNPWPAIEIVVEEVVTAELLTRIWAAMLVSLDEMSGRKELSALAHSIFLSHLEARNRTMRLLLAGRAANEPLFDRINQLRRSVEKWTDLFLSWLPDRDSIRQFSFDPVRFNEYASEHDLYSDQQLLARHQILIRSMSSMLGTLTGKWSANPELNRRIVSGVLACIDREAFDSEGLPKSLQTVWIERAHTDAQVLLNQLESLESGRLVR